jgi:hypothetical protein
MPGSQASFAFVSERLRPDSIDMHRFEAQLGDPLETS